MKLNIPATSLPVVWVVRGKYTSVCLSRETPGLQGAALNSSEEEEAKSFDEQRLPSKCNLTAGSSRSKVRDNLGTSELNSSTL